MNKQTADITENKITALYERLSRDDELAEDRDSIVNQELICKGWFLPSLPASATSFPDIKGFQPELHHYQFYKTGFPLFHKGLSHIIRSYPFPSYSSLLFLNLPL